MRAIGRKEGGSVNRQRCSSRVREGHRCSSSAGVTLIGERWLAGRAHHSGLRASPEEMKLAILPMCAIAHEFVRCRSHGGIGEIKIGGRFPSATAGLLGDARDLRRMPTLRKCTHYLAVYEDALRAGCWVQRLGCWSMPGTYGGCRPYASACTAWQVCEDGTRAGDSTANTPASHVGAV